MGWVLATNGDPQFRNGAEAASMAACACELTRNREASRTFAAACAKAGPIDQAVSPAQRAHDAAVAHGDTNAALRDLQPGRIYRGRKPFYDRDPALPFGVLAPTLPLNSLMARILPGQVNRRTRARSCRWPFSQEGPINMAPAI